MNTTQKADVLAVISENNGAEHVYTAQSWEQARRILESLRPDLPISFGTGNPVCRPYVRAVHLDADSGEGLGYRVAIKPFGDGYGNPAEYFLIYVATTPNAPSASNRDTVTDETNNKRNNHHD